LGGLRGIQKKKNKGFFSPKKLVKFSLEKYFLFSKKKIPKKGERFCPPKKSLGFCKKYNILLKEYSVEIPFLFKK
jgi:hypothetical protein